MPFGPDPFLSKFERLRRLRQKPTFGYLLAVGTVVVASAVRIGFADLLVGVRFAPFYIAVIATAVMGGGRAGWLALALSVASVHFALPSPGTNGPPTEAVATGLFIAIAGTMVVLIWLFNHAIDRGSEQIERTTLILEHQPAGIIGVDAEGRINLVNAAVERQLGYDRDELIDKLVDELVPLELRGLHAGHRHGYMQHPEAKMMGAGRDLSAVAADGSLVPVEIGLNPVQLGKRTGALATIVDISERKRMEQRTQSLANEVSHRAGNLLAVVRALAMRKLPRETTAEFLETLDTLARTQQLFGSRTVAPLRSIVEGELAAFCDNTVISGCEVLLTPVAGQDFSLIVHELATNALKYGALSAANGRVTIVGDLADGAQFRFVWTETGGPPIEAPPERVGFGRKMLQQFAKGLGGRLELDFAPEGLRLELTVPLERISNVSALGNTAIGG